MRFSFALKAALAALFAVLLVVSLAFKAVVYHERAAADPEAVPIVLEELLRDEGFAARIVSIGRKAGVAVRAERGECRLLVGPYEADGTNAELWSVGTGSLGRLRFVYDNSLHDRPPGRSALFDRYLGRLMTRLGLSSGRPVLLAIAAGPECDVEKLPWYRVGHADV